MQTLLVTLIGVYIIISFYFFINWLNFFKQRPEPTPEDRFLSLVILVISTILWPLAIAMYWLEFWKSRKLELSSMIPVILAIFLVIAITKFVSS